MEMYVGVACTRQNLIPEKFDKGEETYFMRFEMDTEDGTIYRRSVIKTTPDKFIDTVLYNQIEGFLYNSMDEEWEKALKDNNIKLYPGRKGLGYEEVVKLFVKE